MEAVGRETRALQFEHVKIGLHGRVEEVEVLRHGRGLDKAANGLPHEPEASHGRHSEGRVPEGIGEEVGRGEAAVVRLVARRGASGDAVEHAADDVRARRGRALGDAQGVQRAGDAGRAHDVVGVQEDEDGGGGLRAGGVARRATADEASVDASSCTISSTRSRRTCVCDRMDSRHGRRNAAQLYTGTITAQRRASGGPRAAGAGRAASSLWGIAKEAALTEGALAGGMVERVITLLVCDRVVRKCVQTIRNCDLWQNEKFFQECCTYTYTCTCTVQNPICTISV